MTREQMMMLSVSHAWNSLEPTQAECDYMGLNMDEVQATIDEWLHGWGPPGDVAHEARQAYGSRADCVGDVAPWGSD